MPRRKYGYRITNIPGKGLTWTTEVPQVPYPAYDDVDLYPAGVSGAEAEALMREFWKILGVTKKQRSAAMKKAWQRIKRRYATL